MSFLGFANSYREFIKGNADKYAKSEDKFQKFEHKSAKSNQTVCII